MSARQLTQITHKNLWSSLARTKWASIVIRLCVELSMSRRCIASSLVIR